MSQAQKLPDFSLMTKEEMESFIKEQMAKANATIEAQRKEHQEQLMKYQAKSHQYATKDLLIF